MHIFILRLPLYNAETFEEVKACSVAKCMEIRETLTTLSSSATKRLLTFFFYF